MFGTESELLKSAGQEPVNTRFEGQLHGDGPNVDNDTEHQSPSLP